MSWDMVAPGETPEPSKPREVYLGLGHVKAASVRVNYSILHIEDVETGLVIADITLDPQQLANLIAGSVIKVPLS